MYLNSDYIPKNQLTALPMDKPAFTERLIQEFQKYSIPATPMTFTNTEELEETLNAFLPEFEKTVPQDLTYFTSDTEIIATCVWCNDQEVAPLTGIQTLPNGFTFLGFLQGDGEETPYVFHILYFDGNQFHIYIPTKGNPVNQDFKTVIGGEDYWSEVDETLIEIEYRKQNLYDPDADWREMYCAKYQTDPDEDCNLIWQGILDDITKTFHLI